MLLRAVRGGARIPKRSLKLLAIASLGAVAPLSAQAPAMAEPMRLDSDCPYARAAAASAEREISSGASVRWSDGSHSQISVFEPGSALAP